MGRRKYTPKPFESMGGNDTFSMIFMSMLKSPAFKDLSNNQQLLYLFMKSEYYGQKHRPMKDYPDIADSIQYFYFNCRIAEEYGYVKSKGNRGKFYDNIKVLVDHGFIETISNGKESKQKSIYKFSEKWKFWKGEK